MKLSVCIEDSCIESYLRDIYDSRKGEGTFDEIMKSITTSPSITTMRFISTYPSNLQHSIKMLESCVLQQNVDFILQKDICGIENTLSVQMCSKNDTCNEDITNRVVIGVRCAESVVRGADVFVPGVITADRTIIQGSKVLLIADIHSNLLKGAKLSELDLIDEKSRPVIGMGIAQMSRVEMRDGTNGTAVIVTKRFSNVASTRYMPSLNSLSHLFFFQNLPSLIPSLALNPPKNATVLDMCAAPGGKTTHLASLVGQGGRVLAVERSKKRAAELNTFVKSISEYKDVVQVFTGDSKNLKAVLPEKWANNDALDFVLLDAPCSGLGLRPRFLECITWTDFISRGAYQLRLMREAVRVLAPGGKLVFSTCTMSPLEGEIIVGNALKDFPELDLIDVGINLGDEGLKGLGLDEEECKKVRRFTPPTCVEDMEGMVEDWSAFFVALFQKKNQ